MASVNNTISDSSENSDLGTVQQLVCSLGHLKFSLRALASMHLQSALYSQKETEPSSNFTPMESNRVLENIINEVLAKEPNQNEENIDACKSDEIEKSVSVEDLELVQKKLQEEFEKRRCNFISLMSSRLKE